jgi:hypothetical protein
MTVSEKCAIYFEDAIGNERRMENTLLLTVDNPNDTNSLAYISALQALSTCSITAISTDKDTLGTTAPSSGPYDIEEKLVQSFVGATGHEETRFEIPAPIAAVIVDGHDVDESNSALIAARGFLGSVLVTAGGDAVTWSEDYKSFRRRKKR